MVTTQDASLGLALESTYGTGVTPTRFYEFLSEGLQFNKSVKQGQGLRVGSRVGRTNRRVVTSASAGGDVALEAFSKGLGTLLQMCMGSATSTMVSTGVYQQVFTLGDVLPSATLQKGVVKVDGAGAPTVDAYTFLGAVVSAFQLTFGNDEIAQLSASYDARDVTTATAYAAPSYPTGGGLFHFGDFQLHQSITSVATATALAAGGTVMPGARSGSLSVNHNLNVGRYNAGGLGRKDKPTTGMREVTGSLEVEYRDNVIRDAVLNDSPLALLGTWQAESLTTGRATLQIVLPSIRIENQLPQANGTDLVTQSVNYTVLDNLTDPPIQIVVRTSDTAL